MAASRPTSRSAASASGTSGRWLFGPVPDLMLGCGGLYFCVLSAFAVGGADLRGAEAAWLGPLLVLLLGAPHYGATLLRVYEQRADRRSYWVFSVYATLVIAAAFVVSLYSGFVASCLVTLYLTWSPWHYTGQNYGLAVLFLRRRGVEMSGAVKRALYASFVLSYALTFLVFHGDAASAPTPEFASGPRGLFVSLGIPAALTGVLFPTLLAGYFGAVIASGVLLLRRCSASDLLPAAVMVLSQGLWFSIPVVLRYWRVSVGIDPLRWELRDYYFFWIALGHATQYLWITAYYARQTSHWKSFGAYFGKTLVTGTAIWTLPVILFDPGRVGDLPNTTALAVLVASAVNIHHFVLDGAIWKLRHSRIASVLIRRGEASPGDLELSADAPRPWQRRTVWAIAWAGCLLALFKYAHEEVLFTRAVGRNDFAAAEAVLDRLDLVTRVSDEARARVREAAERYGRLREQYDRRLERRVGLIPNAAPQQRRAQQHAERGEWREALNAYEAGLKIDPVNPTLLRGAGRAWLELGEPQRAIAALEHAVELNPWDRASQALLDHARTAAN